MLLAVLHQVIVCLGSLESTQEARVSCSWLSPGVALVLLCALQTFHVHHNSTVHPTMACRHIKEGGGGGGQLVKKRAWWAEGDWEGRRSPSPPPPFFPAFFFP